jgi:hypothetical protein
MPVRQREIRGERQSVQSGRKRYQRSRRDERRNDIARAPSASRTTAKPTFSAVERLGRLIVESTFTNASTAAPARRIRPTEGSRCAIERNGADPQRRFMRRVPAASRMSWRRRRRWRRCLGLNIIRKDESERALVRAAADQRDAFASVMARWAIVKRAACTLVLRSAASKNLHAIVECSPRASPSSRGPGRRPFTPVTRVRIPLGT